MEQRERGILYFDEWTFSVVEARRIMWRKGWFKNARIITSCVRIIKMRGTLCEKSCVTRVFFEYVGNYNSVHFFFFFDYISNLRNGFLLLVSYVFIFNCHAVSTRENGNYFFFPPEQWEIRFLRTLYEESWVLGFPLSSLSPTSW